MKISECYAINEVYREFEYKFDLGFKEVETRKEESDTLPGVFYDVIKMENARGEVKFQLKLNGEYCCHPNKEFCNTGLLKFVHTGDADKFMQIVNIESWEY